MNNPTTPDQIDQIVDSLNLLLNAIEVKGRWTQEGHKPTLVLTLDEPLLEAEADTQNLQPMPVITGNPSLRMGTPTDEQLAKMNRYRPMGASEYTSSEVVTVPLLASHNLIQLSGGLVAWHPRSLQRMTDVMVDKPHQCDHEWDEVKHNIGFIYDAELIVSNSAPAEIMGLADQYDLNRMIVDKYGFHQLVLSVCLQAGTPAVDSYRFRRLGDVSTGNLCYARYICPIDDRDFDDPECPYIPPTPDIIWALKNGQLSTEEAALVAPYMLRDGVFYGVELSAVVVGNLPGAGVIRNG